MAGLSAEIREKATRISELSQKLEALARIEEERDGLAKEIEDLRAQDAQLKAKHEQDEAGVVEHLKAELDEMAKKEASSTDTARKLTRENQQLLEKLSTMKRERDELIKNAESIRDEITIVSHTRKDGTQPETTAPPEDVAEATPGSTPGGTPPEDVLGSTQPEEEPPEDELPEVEPEPMLLIHRPPEPPFPSPSPAPVSPGSAPASPAPARRRSAGWWLLRVFLFLVLAGTAYFAAQRFLPELLAPSGAGTKPADVVMPEDTKPPSAALSVPGEPTPEVPESPEEALEETPLAPVEEPVEKTVKKKKGRTEKQKPKKTAKAPEPEMTAREAKKQARRLISSKQLDEAQKLLADWVKKHPRDAGIRYLYGRLHILRGDKSAAVDQLDEAIELAPKMASAYHDLGAIYLQLGETDLACETLGHFVRLKPSHQRTPAIKDLLKKIKCP